MRRCLILTAHVEGAEHLQINPADFEEIIAADGGLAIAKTLRIRPTKIIGDFDSSEWQEKNAEIPAKPLRGSAKTPFSAEQEAASFDRTEADPLIVLPREKDMTDSEAAIDLAIARGYRNIVVLGGLGGRFDHTMGNIGLLAKSLNSVDWLEYQDGYNRVFMRGPERFSVEKGRFQYLGLIAYGGTVSGLTLENVKYPLTNAVLTDDTTLGVSNEILGDRPEAQAEISFRSGRLLVIQSNDIH